MKDKKLQEVLTEIREIAGMDAALFSDAAELLVAPFSDMNIRKTDVKAFFVFGSGRVAAGGVLFFKITIPEAAYVLVLPQIATETVLVGRLAVCQIRNLLSLETQPMSRGAVHFRGIAWKVGTDRGFKYDAKTAHCIFCMDGLCPSDGGKDRDRLYGDLKKSFCDRRHDFFYYRSMKRRSCLKRCEG